MDTPHILYHAAPAAERESILTFGLDPSRYAKERWGGDAGVWFFDSLTRARDYAEGRERAPGAGPYDVWEADGSNLVATRPWYDPALNSGVDVWHVSGPIPAVYVRPCSLAAL